ncbi:MAG: hypothetical protein HGA31_03990 [Candidatus Moranbacteria bacterium]|nr:hypothetical protein [Candidatus Moranbacteria bacterium]
MDEELRNRLDAQEKRLDVIFVSVEKTRKYFLWTLIATLVTFVLPLIVAIFLVPMAVGPFTSQYGL